MTPIFFDISPTTLNLFSFMLGMTFAAFLSWYKRVAFRFIVGYFMALAFYYGAVKPNTTEPPFKNAFKEAPDYSPPLPMPTPRNYK
jgi:hypothetical protein